MNVSTHQHSAITCAHDSEGPSIWWLCGYEPMFTPRVDPTPRTTVSIDSSWWDRDDDRDDGPVDDYDDPRQPR